MQDVLESTKLDTISLHQAANPTVTNIYKPNNVGFLDNPRRIKPDPALRVPIREGVLREAASRAYADGIQQQALPDRRYGTNNSPSQQLKYYTGGQWDMTKHQLQPKSYKYYRTGVPYIPAWQVIDQQPVKNILGSNPSNSLQVIVPDLYYQEQDRQANPRTENPNLAQKQYERQVEHFMTSYLLRDRNAWNRHMILNYVRAHPDQFYQPVVHADSRQPTAQEILEHEGYVKTRHIMRRPNGKRVAR